MNKNHFYIISGTAVLLALFIAILTIWPSSPAKESDMIVENVKSIPATGAQSDGHTYRGTGDPLRFRVPPAPLKAGVLEDNRTYMGTGDPLHFRAMPPTRKAGSQEDGPTYMGTGDPLLFRALLPTYKTQNNNGSGISGEEPNGPTMEDCFSPHYHAASDCDRLASDW